VIESFVDLTYRGLALGRRIKLSEVRPRTAFVELTAPMPVGTRLAIVTEDGLALDATVTWIHEQVAGAERAPGMFVAPVLAAEPAAAWWQARVALPDDDQPRPRPARGRPVTVRPRTNTERNKSTTDRSPPPEHALADEVPTMMTAPPVNLAPELDDDSQTIVADLTARVTAAARVELPKPSLISTEANERATVAMHPLDASARATMAMDPLEANERPTVMMRAVDQAQLAQATMRQTGEHAVVDDGKATMIMDAVDPATLGFDLPGSTGAAPAAVGDEPSAPVITIEAGEGDDDGEGGEGGDDASDGAPGPGGAEPGGSSDKPSAGKGLKRRRKRR
jgi:hypothetical protein